MFVHVPTQRSSGRPVVLFGGGERYKWNEEYKKRKGDNGVSEPLLCTTDTVAAYVGKHTLHSWSVVGRIARWLTARRIAVATTGDLMGC